MQSFTDPQTLRQLRHPTTPPQGESSIESVYCTSGLSCLSSVCAPNRACCAPAVLQLSIRSCSYSFGLITSCLNDLTPRKDMLSCRRAAGRYCAIDSDCSSSTCRAACCTSSISKRCNECSKITGLCIRCKTGVLDSQCSESSGSATTLLHLTESIIAGIAAAISSVVCVSLGVCYCIRKRRETTSNRLFLLVKSTSSSSRCTRGLSHRTAIMMSCQWYSNRLSR